MKSTSIASILLAGLVFAGAPTLLHADQRTRNPGGDSGGSSGGSSSGGGGTDTGTSGVSRGGGSTPWGGGGVSSRPSEPTSSPSTGSSGARRPARVSSGGTRNGSGGGYQGMAPYSRARGDAPVTGYGVARGSIATLPPIVSGPIYWGPDNWYFYPWGFGGLGLGYFWDPWMWSGYYGGMAYGGYPYVDPYYGGGMGSWDGGGGSSDESGQQQASPTSDNPLDQNLPTGALRLKVEPRDAEVFVDGFYAGRVDDFDGAMQKLKIVHGTRRIELRAPGYETATFTVNVLIGETTTYKTELKRN